MDNVSIGEVIALSKAFGGSGGGSGGGVLVVHETVSDITHTLDKTWQEIVDAGFAVLHITRSNGSTDIYELRNFGHDAVIGYQVSFYDLQQGSWAYQVDSATGYPSYEE